MSAHEGGFLAAFWLGLVVLITAGSQAQTQLPPVFGIETVYSSKVRSTSVCDMHAQRRHVRLALILRQRSLDGAPLFGSGLHFQHWGRESIS